MRKKVLAIIFSLCFYLIVPFANATARLLVTIEVLGDERVATLPCVDARSSDYRAAKGIMVTALCVVCIVAFWSIFHICFRRLTCQGADGSAPTALRKDIAFVAQRIITSQVGGSRDQLAHLGLRSPVAKAKKLLDEAIINLKEVVSIAASLWGGRVVPLQRVRVQAREQAETEMEEKQLENALRMEQRQGGVKGADAHEEEKSVDYAGAELLEDLKRFKAKVEEADEESNRRFKRSATQAAFSLEKIDAQTLTNVLQIARIIVVPVCISATASWENSDRALFLIVVITISQALSRIFVSLDSQFDVAAMTLTDAGLLLMFAIIGFAGQPPYSVGVLAGLFLIFFAVLVIILGLLFRDSLAGCCSCSSRGRAPRRPSPPMRQSPSPRFGPAASPKSPRRQAERQN
jgi:hypothetical protein